MERWQGKVAIVSGASAGIGSSITTQLVQHGVHVVGLARRVERVQELAKKLAGQKGKVYACKVDMMKESEIVAAFKWTTENVGPVSILINNAGLKGNTTLINGDTEQWKTVLDTNVLGLCIATREAIKIMEENKIAGHIVNINSIVGHHHLYCTGISVYGASKKATLDVSEVLRHELNERQSKIKISNISPGVVATEFQSKANETYQEAAAKFPKLHPDDIANAIMYALGTPPLVNVFDVVIKPLGEEL